MYFLNSYNICQNGFMYDFLSLFVSIYGFGISSCILSEIKPTVWPCCCKLLFALQELPNVKVLCNVSKPQPMKTDLMLRQYIVEFWTNCGKWEINTIQDRHRNDPVTHLFLWLWMTSKETKSYVEENEHFSHCAWWHGAVSTENVIQEDFITMLQSFYCCNIVLQ